jgi:hypothetical protein
MKTLTERMEEQAKLSSLKESPRTLDRSRWLAVDSLQALECIEKEMNKQGVKPAKLLEGQKIAMLIALNKPYSNGCQEFDKIIYRRFNERN